MAKGKYEYWLTDEGQLLLSAWARDGLTDEQIAHNMGIDTRTLYRWKNKYSRICQPLKKGKEIIDIAVENALLKKALSGDVTALIYWLKNRKPEKWRDKRDIADEVNLITLRANSNIVDALTSVTPEVWQDEKEEAKDEE